VTLRQLLGAVVATMRYGAAVFKIISAKPQQSRSPFLHDDSIYDRRFTISSEELSVPHSDLRTPQIVSCSKPLVLISVVIGKFYHVCQSVKLNQLCAGDGINAFHEVIQSS
jgi:hypothetical protein